MCCFDSETGSAGASIFELPCSAKRAKGIVNDEPEWRVLRQPYPMALSASRIIATRWHASDKQTREFDAETIADGHVVKIVLRNMDIRFSVSGRTVQDGATCTGTVHVTEPAARVRCLFRGPYDVLHLHVPNSLIAEYMRDMPGHPVPVLRSGTVPGKDAGARFARSQPARRLFRTALRGQHQHRHRRTASGLCKSPDDFRAIEAEQTCAMAPEASHRLCRGPTR